MINIQQGIDRYTHERGTMSAMGIVAPTGLRSRPTQFSPNYMAKHSGDATLDPICLQNSTTTLESILDRQETGPYIADILPSAGTHPKIMIEDDVNSLGQTDGGIAVGLEPHVVASSQSIIPATAKNNVRNRLHEGLAEAHAQTLGSEYIGQLYLYPAVVPLDDPDSYNRWGRVPWHPVDDGNFVHHHGYASVPIVPLFKSKCPLGVLIV